MIYFFYGNNDYEREHKIGAIRADFQADQITTFDLTEDDLAIATREIFSLDLFQSTKLFILRDAFANTQTRALLDDLVTNLARLPDQNTIIVTDAKPDKRTKIFKELTEQATAQEFLKLKSYALKPWLSDEIATRRLNLDTNTKNELITRKLAADDPQSAIAAELDKLALLPEPIDITTIREFVDDSPIANVFAILEFALKNRRATVQIELLKLRHAGEDPNRFLGLLTTQIIAIAAIVFGADAHALKVQPFQLAKARDMIQQMPHNTRPAFVKRLTRALANTDAAMKISNADEAWVMVEKFLMTLNAS